MPYIMEFYIDGGCRGNGQPIAIGAAAACLMKRGRKYYHYKTRLLEYNWLAATPTSQRAELTAAVLALEWAVQRHQELYLTADLRVKIKTDSRYVVGCMTEWVYKWRHNGWMNARGCEVANRDLIEKAFGLVQKIQDYLGGRVDFSWVPREDNPNAHRHCDDLLDEYY